jgi:hypothetical protein
LGGSSVLKRIWEDFCRETTLLRSEKTPSIQVKILGIEDFKKLDVNSNALVWPGLKFTGRAAMYFYGEPGQIISVSGWGPEDIAYQWAKNNDPVDLILRNSRLQSELPAGATFDVIVSAYADAVIKRQHLVKIRPQRQKTTKLNIKNRKSARTRGRMATLMEFGGIFRDVLSSLRSRLSCLPTPGTSSSGSASSTSSSAADNATATHPPSSTSSATAQPKPDNAVPCIVTWIIQGLGKATMTATNRYATAVFFFLKF